MKKYIILVLVAIVLIVAIGGYISMLWFAGVFQTEYVHFTEDYLEQYGDFLQHSLSDFVLLHEGTGGDDFLTTVWRWRTWRVQFTHQNGEEKTFFFTNHQPMFDTVAHYARQIGDAQLEERRYEVDAYLASLDHVDSIFLALPFFGDPAHLTDPQHGLRLSYPITWQALIEDWGFVLRAVVHSRSESRPEALEEMKQLIRILAYYTEQEQIDVHFIHWPSEESSRHSRFQYNRQADTFCP